MSSVTLFVLNKLASHYPFVSLSTSSMSDMFSKESRRENKMAIPSRDDKSDEETVIVDVLSTSETTERLGMEEDYNEVLEETTQIATQSDVSFDKELVEVLHSMSAWVLQNYHDIIIADTAGVPSIAVELLGVFLICFLASIYILSPSKTKKPTLRPNPLVKRPRSIIFHNNRPNNAEVVNRVIKSNTKTSISTSEDESLRNSYLTPT